MMELSGEPLCTPDQVSGIIDNVTYDDVNRIARELFSSDLPVMVVAGPRKTRSFLVRR